MGADVSASGEPVDISFGPRLRPIDQSTLVLGIETSCDETAAAIVMGGRDVISSVVSSQVDLQRTAAWCRRSPAARTSSC